MATTGRGKLVEENETHAVAVVTQNGERPDLYRITNKEEGDYTEGQGLTIQNAMRDFVDQYETSKQLPEDDFQSSYNWSEEGFAKEIELRLLGSGEGVSFYDEDHIFDLLELFKELPDFTPEEELTYVPMDDVE